ncbi:MAG: hypothetical protein LBQ10_03845 [Desulfovibrio sp.]|nr:hypothetical protein [Desulfovibrio sp.]
MPIHTESVTGDFSEMTQDERERRLAEGRNFLLVVFIWIPLAIFATLGTVMTLAMHKWFYGTIF